MKDELTNLKSHVLEMLTQLFAAHRELPRLSFQDLAERVWDLTIKNEKELVISFFSDSLTLSHKILLEKAAKNSLPSWVVSFYFKRRLDEESLKTHSPIEMQRSEKPFGLKIARKKIPQVDKIILVASGKGGVGKSTVSTNLALSLAQRGLQVGILDADIYGPSLPMMLGLTPPLRVNSQNQLIPLEKFGLRCMSFGLLKDSHEPVVWRGPLLDKAIEQMCFSVDWGALDVLVVDLPPGTGDVQLTFAERVLIDGVVLVSTPQDVALLDAYKALSMFRQLNVKILGLVENMSSHVCRSCGNEDFVFGHDAMKEFVKFSGLPLLGSIPLDFRLRAGADAGIPLVLSDDPFRETFSHISQTVWQAL